MHVVIGSTAASDRWGNVNFQSGEAKYQNGGGGLCTSGLWAKTTQIQQQQTGYVTQNTTLHYKFNIL